MTFEKIPYKIYLTEDEMPMNWYNVRADMKTKPAPLLNPATGTPMGFDDLRPVFCDELIRQELDNDTREIPIPQEIRDFYKMYRPSPLVRAYCLEEKLQTPDKIYYKFEGNNTSGSHKLNSAIAQAYYAKNQGSKGVTTEHRRRRDEVSPLHGLLLPGAGLPGLHGEGQLRAEAFPAGGYADLRRRRHPLPLRYHQCRPGHSEGAPGYHRLPGLCHFRGSGSRRQPARLPLCAGQRP